MANNTLHIQPPKKSNGGLRGRPEIYGDYTRSRSHKIDPDTGRLTSSFNVESSVVDNVLDVDCAGPDVCRVDIPTKGLGSIELPASGRLWYGHETFVFSVFVLPLVC